MTEIAEKVYDAAAGIISGSGQNYVVPDIRTDAAPQPHVSDVGQVWFEDGGEFFELVVRQIDPDEATKRLISGEQEQQDDLDGSTTEVPPGARAESRRPARTAAARLVVKSLREARRKA